MRDQQSGVLSLSEFMSKIGIGTRHVVVKVTDIQRINTVKSRLSTFLTDVTRTRERSRLGRFHSLSRKRAEMNLKKC